MKFVLEIEMNNDGMCTKHAVAEKIYDIAGEIIMVGEVNKESYSYGSIKDINGNRVGHWEFRKEEGDKP